jgi:hypothetical protein
MKKEKCMFTEFYPKYVYSPTKSKCLITQQDNWIDDPLWMSFVKSIKKLSKKFILVIWNDPDSNDSLYALYKGKLK